MGPGRAAGPDGADIRRMSFLFFQKRIDMFRSIPLGCCFSFLLALFIWAGRGTIQTVKKTEKARGAAAENEVTYADFRHPCPL